MAEGIPDEAVELAAHAIAEEHCSTVFEPDHEPNEYTEAERASYRTEAQAAVEAAAPLIVARAQLAERVKIVREIRERAEKIRGETWTPSVGVALGAIVNDVADMVNTLPEDGPGPHTAGTTEPARLAEVDTDRTATCPVCHRVTNVNGEDRFTHHTSDGVTYCPGSGEEVPVSESADG